MCIALRKVFFYICWILFFFFFWYLLFMGIYDYLAALRNGRREEVFLNSNRPLDYCDYRMYLQNQPNQSQNKAGRNNRPNDNGRQSNHSTIYQNILSPGIKIQCADCKRDISKTSKLVARDHHYCTSCFTNLDNYPETYRAINKLDFPMFDPDWTAEDELLLFEGLQKHGFGNWGEIADFITNKTREDVEWHYQQIYLAPATFLPSENLLSRRDANGLLIQNHRETSQRRLNKSNLNSAPNQQQHNQRASLTVNQTNKTGNNPAEIVGFMPKRGDFEVEYDNDAELLLAQMQFNDDDTEEQKAMKFRLIDIYNHKLNQRIKRKEFVISRKLLDLREQIRLDKTRTKQQKEIYNMMKVFARFNPPQEHQRLVQGIIKQKQIRQRIQELKQLKKKGFRNLGQVQQELESKKKKDDKSKRREVEDKMTRRMRKQPNSQKTQKRVLFINKQEEQLCKKLNMTFKQYMMIKQTILRESVKLGIIGKDDASCLFKINRSIIDAVFDFLVEREDIISKDSHEIQI